MDVSHLFESVPHRFFMIISRAAQHCFIPQEISVPEQPPRFSLQRRRTESMPSGFANAQCPESSCGPPVLCERWTHEWRSEDGWILTLDLRKKKVFWVFFSTFWDPICIKCSFEDLSTQIRGFLLKKCYFSWFSKWCNSKTSRWILKPDPGNESQGCVRSISDV